MRQTAQIILVLLIAVWVSDHTLPLRAQISEDWYAYIVINSDGTGIVRVVNPRNVAEVAILTAFLPINEGESFREGHLSPTGEWLLLVLDSGEERVLRLLGLRNGEIVDVIDNIRLTDIPPTLNAPPQVFSWSPNGDYFAISYGKAGDDSQGTYLYNLRSRTLSNLTSPGTNHYRLAWSNDSSRLAVGSTVCTPDTCLRASIDVFNAATASLVYSVDVTDLSSGPGGQSTNFCNLHWSTNDTRIAFVDQCDGSGLGAPREVRIINLNDLAITRATHFTPTTIAPANSMFVARYELVWMNDEILLIGMEKQEGVLFETAGPLTARTFQFDASSQTIQEVSMTLLGEWARANPTLFGYLVYTYPDNPQWGTLPENAHVEVAVFNGRAFDTIASASSGCKLTWNATGTILAYLEREVRSVSTCSPRAAIIHFVDSVTGNVTIHMPAEEKTYALGWIRYGPVTPIPTETPLPTLTPLPIPTPTPPPSGMGTGLQGEYFNKKDFTRLALTRIDPTIDFDWGRDSPAPEVQKNSFSVRWTGQVEPLYSETYTFYTLSDDGVRLWINGQLLIDDWNNHSVKENSGTITLVAGQRYDIRMEYYEDGGIAVAKLLWSSPSQVREIIPQSQLSPPEP